jgi:hypothetical protein
MGGAVPAQVAKDHWPEARVAPKRPQNRGRRPGIARQVYQEGMLTYRCPRKDAKGSHFSTRASLSHKWPAPDSEFMAMILSSGFGAMNAISLSRYADSESSRISLTLMPYLYRLEQSWAGR